MNHAYRLIWSELSASPVAVPETASGRGKSRGRRLARGLAGAWGISACAISARAAGALAAGVAAAGVSGRGAGESPPTMFDYLRDDALLIIDESHVTVPQVGAMYKGDKSRKENLVDYGWRLPSALDNRPLKFEEFEQIMRQRPAVDAIFFCNDDLAQGALLAAMRMSIAVPQQIAIAGFNDLTGSDQMWPPLTTVRTPRAQVGEAAAKMLLQLIHGEVPEQPQLDLGFEIVANTPEQFTAYQAAEFARWKKLIQSRDIKAD